MVQRWFMRAGWKDLTALLFRVLSNLPLIHPLYTHWWQQGAGSHQAQFGVQCQCSVDTSTSGQDQTRIDPPTLWSVDNPFYLLSHSICSLHYTLNTHPERKSLLTLNHWDTISCHVYIVIRAVKPRSAAEVNHSLQDPTEQMGNSFYYLADTLYHQIQRWSSEKLKPAVDCGLEIKRFCTDDWQVTENTRQKHEQWDKSCKQTKLSTPPWSKGCVGYMLQWDVYCMPCPVSVAVDLSWLSQLARRLCFNSFKNTSYFNTKCVFWFYLWTDVGDLCFISPMYVFSPFSKCLCSLQQIV